MAEDKSFKITIRIADIPEFGLTINRDEEEYYRHAVKEINSMWSNWITRLDNKDSHRIMAVIAIKFAKQFYQTLAQHKVQDANSKDVINKTNEIIEDFEKEIDKILLKF